MDHDEVGHGFDTTDLDKLRFTLPRPFIWRRVAGQELAGGEFGADPLSEGRNLLPIKTTVYKLLVLKKNQLGN